MNKTQYLLNQASEECAETAQRASKAIRFGLKEVEPGQSLNNEERFWGELIDLFAAIQLLCDDGILTEPDEDFIDKKVAEKQDKIKKMMDYSRHCGQLDPE
jgi:hypothetical protein